MVRLLPFFWKGAVDWGDDNVSRMIFGSLYLDKPKHDSIWWTKVLETYIIFTICTIFGDSA